MADNEKMASVSRLTQKEGEFGLHLSVDYKIIYPSSLPFFRFLIGRILTYLFISSHVSYFVKLCLLFRRLGASFYQCLPIETSLMVKGGRLRAEAALPQYKKARNFNMTPESSDDHLRTSSSIRNDSKKTSSFKNSGHKCQYWNRNCPQKNPPLLLNQKKTGQY